MKKLIVSSIICIILSFICGCATGHYGWQSQHRVEYNLLLEKAALSDSIMWRNNVFDMDGGDQVAKYLEISSRLDTLLAK